MAEANEKRDCRIFEKFAYEMSVEVQQTCISDSDFNLSIKENIYAFDSIIIDLYLNFFWWVSLKKQKNCIKLHTQFDIKTAIPVFIYIISASIHDVNGQHQLTYETGGFYIMDPRNL